VRTATTQTVPLSSPSSKCHIHSIYCNSSCSLATSVHGHHRLVCGGIAIPFLPIDQMTKRAKSPLPACICQIWFSLNINWRILPKLSIIAILLTDTTGINQRCYLYKQSCILCWASLRGDTLLFWCAMLSFGFDQCGRAYSMQMELNRARKDPRVRATVLRLLSGRFELAVFTFDQQQIMCHLVRVWKLLFVCSPQLSSYTARTVLTNKDNLASVLSRHTHKSPVSVYSPNASKVPVKSGGRSVPPL